MAGVLSREALLAADNLKTETVEVPEWGGSVVVRELPLGVYQDCRKLAEVAGATDADRLSIYLIIAGVVEPELKPEDYELVRGLSMAALNRVADAIMRLSNLLDGAVEEAEARFPEGPGDPLHVPAGEGPGDDGLAAPGDAQE